MLSGVKLDHDQVSKEKNILQNLSLRLATLVTV